MKRRGSVWLAALLLALTACGAGSGSSSGATATPAGATAARGTAATPTPPAVQGQLLVFAAASLTDSFNQMARNIQQANPETKITFNFAGSPTLRTQLAQGARADVFASADQPNMQGAQQDGSIAGTPQIFALNRLVVVVPASGGPVDSLQDLAKPGVKIDLAQPAVPVGNYARQAFMKMAQDPHFGAGFDTKVLGNVVSQELDVKTVLSKVALGEADAGVTYTTDVTPDFRARVKEIAIPDQFNVIAQYPIAVVKGAPNLAGAQEFIDYVLSPAGQQVLKDNGFVIPGG
jgi:molybdate transport system substrate-binding protein